MSGAPTHRIPLAPSQRGIYFLHRLAPGSPVYNVPIALRVRGPLSLERLQRAVDALVVRHEALRTTFEENGGMPVQVVHPPGDAPRVAVRMVHAAVEPDGDPVAAAAAEIERGAAAPFDLNRGPLWRVDVVPVGAGDHAVALTFDHIVLDETSVTVLARDLRTAYADPDALPAADPARGYAECCRRELEAPDAQGLAYWRDNLRGADTGALPYDRTAPPGPPAASVDGGRLRFGVDESTATLLPAFCAAHKVTPFMVFHAAFAALLHGWTGRDDIAIGTVVQGRADERFAETVGYFQNTVVLRSGVRPGQSFADLLARSRRTVLGALQHRRVPFEAVVEAVRPARGGGGNPLFQAALGYNRVRVEREWELDGLAVEPLPFEWPITQFDLTLTLQHDLDAIHGEITYDTGRFRDATMLRLAAAFADLLAAAVAGPARSLADLPRLRPLPAGTGLPPRPARPARIPLSYAQRGPWLLHQMRGPSPACAIPMMLRFAGPVDAPALGAAVRDVVARHEILRTLFVRVDGEPYQVVRGPAEHGVRMRVVATTDEKLDAALRDAALHAFDPAAEEPVRATLFTAPGGDTLLLLVHRIACDGGSLGLLGRDLGTAYAARCAGAAPDWADLPAQYADFTLWQRARLGTPDDPDSLAARQTAFWRTALSGMPEELSLPSDRPRPPIASHRAGTVTVDWDADLHAALADLADATGTSLFMVLQAGLAALLNRLGAGIDIGIGAPAGVRGHEAFEDLVGAFATTVVLRTDVSGDPAFRELLHRVRRADLAAFAAADLPFDQVVRAVNPVRTPARHPLFQVMLSLHRDPGAYAAPGGATVSIGRTHTGTAEFDLSVVLCDAYEDGVPAGIRGVLEYATDLFDGGSAEALVSRLGALLRLAAAGPDRRLSDMDLNGPEERRWLAAAGTGAHREIPAVSLPDLVARQAARSPHATALVRGPVSVSYAALCSRVNRLARLLMARGVGAESLVVVALPPSADLVVALLGVLTAGGACVPVDADLPAEWVAKVLEDVDPAVVITDGVTAPPWPAPDDRRTLVMSADTAAGHPDREIGAAERAPVAMADAAYVAVTSGEAGLPNGVVIEHGQLANYLAYAADAYPGLAGTVPAPAGPACVGTASAGIASPSRLIGLLAPLTVGGAVHLPDPGDPMTTQPRPSLVRTVPSRLPLLADLPAGASPTGELVLAGQTLIGDALRVWRRLHPHATVINEYGSAETAGCCTAYRIEPGRPAPPGPVPIGRPICNTRVYVLDAQLRPVPVGVPGEICIGGAAVARGYLGNPKWTAQRFPPDPFGPPGGRMYRTGDLGRWDAAGDLWYLGPADQATMRGSRVETGTVAAALAAHPWVDDAIVTVQTRPQPRLVAYVVPSAAGVTAAELRAYLSDRIASHLVPADFVRLAALPLSADGTVDRRSLPAPAARPASRRPRTPTEAALHRMFTRVLSRTDVGVDDDFFDLGGHSLLAVRLTDLIGRHLAVRVPVGSLIARPTVAALAAHLDAVAAGAHHQRDTIAPGNAAASGNAASAVVAPGGAPDVSAAVRHAADVVPMGDGEVVGA